MDRRSRTGLGAGPQLTRTLAADRQPAYSPDGLFVVFSSNRTGNLDLRLLDRESRALRQLTDDASQYWDPGFGADGRRVLFSSSTRRPVAGFYDELQTESFGVAPDGSRVTLAVIRETYSLMLADGPDVAP